MDFDGIPEVDDEVLREPLRDDFVNELLFRSETRDVLAHDGANALVESFPMPAHIPMPTFQPARQIAAIRRYRRYHTRPEEMFHAGDVREELDAHAHIPPGWYFNHAVREHTIAARFGSHWDDNYRLNPRPYTTATHHTWYLQSMFSAPPPAPIYQMARAWIDEYWRSIINYYPPIRTHLAMLTQHFFLPRLPIDVIEIILDGLELFYSPDVYQEIEMQDDDSITYRLSEAIHELTLLTVTQIVTAEYNADAHQGVP